MTHREIMARLGEIFRDVFDDDGIVLSDSTTSADIDGWDSIMHITLIGEVRFRRAGYQYLRSVR